MFSPFYIYPPYRPFNKNSSKDNKNESKSLK